MINELNNEFAKFPKLKNYLYTRALKSGKAFGEDLELFLPGLFNLSGRKSEKETKRNQEYDINVDGKKYSLKSSTSKEMQINGLFCFGVMLPVAISYTPHPLAHLR